MLDKLNILLSFATEHKELTGAVLLALVEIVSRKIPGTITFLHSISKVLDLIPGLKNNKG